MKTKNKTLNEMSVYQTKDGAIELKNDVSHETIWASIDQIGSIFGRNKSVISRHIKNVVANGELNRHSVVAFFATTAADGKVYNVEYFNLDMILSVGYRVNSKQATNFRKWANSILKQHITQGYTINLVAIKNNYNQFLEAVNNVKQLIPKTNNVDADNVLELVIAFADTWLSLDAYDRGNLITSGVTKKSVSLTALQVKKVLGEFKAELIKKGEATELFAKEREKDALSGIIGNVMQSFSGQNLYSTLEEKAAHLLYFIIKNHPFIDGNKRSGAFVFIWFLKKTNLLEWSKITTPALTVLALFIAESDPKNREKMISLVLQLLKKQDFKQNPNNDIISKDLL